MSNENKMHKFLSECVDKEGNKFSVQIESPTESIVEKVIESHQEFINRALEMLEREG